MTMETPTKNHSDRQGFTLMELIVVLSILTAMSLSVMPAFKGALDNIKKEGAIDDLVAAMQLAQSNAINQGVIHRVYLNKEESTYWTAHFTQLPNGDYGYVPNDDNYGKPKSLPPELSFRKITARRDKSRDKAYYVAFYPTGARDEAKVSIRDETNRWGGYELTTKGSITRIDISE